MLTCVHLNYIMLSCCYAGGMVVECCRTRLEDQKLVIDASRQFKVHERNHPTHELELAAVVIV